MTSEEKTASRSDYNGLVLIIRGVFDSAAVRKAVLHVLERSPNEQWVKEIKEEIDSAAERLLYDLSREVSEGTRERWAAWERRAKQGDLEREIKQLEEEIRQRKKDIEKLR